MVYRGWEGMEGYVSCTEILHSTTSGSSVKEYIVQINNSTSFKEGENEQTHQKGWAMHFTVLV